MTRGWSGCAECTYTCVAPAANSSSMRRAWAGGGGPPHPRGARPLRRGELGGAALPPPRVGLRYELAHHRAELPQRRDGQRLVLVPDDRVQLRQDRHLAGAPARRGGGGAERLPYLRPLGQRGGVRYPAVAELAGERGGLRARSRRVD